MQRWPREPSIFKRKNGKAIEPLDTARSPRCTALTFYHSHTMITILTQLPLFSHDYHHCRTIAAILTRLLPFSHDSHHSHTILTPLHHSPLHHFLNNQQHQTIIGARQNVLTRVARDATGRWRFDHVCPLVDTCSGACSGGTSVAAAHALSRGGNSSMRQMSDVC